MMFNKYPKTPLGRFRLVGVLEGFSYLILLGIAMPLKYFAGRPEAVKYFGWAHGVLFVAFSVLLLQVWIRYKWSFLKTTAAFIASLLPFGTFILDRRLKKEYPLE
jgi:integral membrane protein